MNSTDAVFSDAQVFAGHRAPAAFVRSYAHHSVLDAGYVAAVGSLAWPWRSPGRLGTGPGRADGCWVQNFNEHVLPQLAQGGVPWPSLWLLLALVWMGAATLMFAATQTSLSLTDDG